MATMIEGEMSVEITFKRDKPHPHYGKKTKIQYCNVDVLCLPESSPSEDYTKQEIVEMVSKHYPKPFSDMLKAGWEVDVEKVDVSDYNEIGHDEY